jgi:hypothetical protein
VGADLLDLHSGDHMLVVIDYYSRWSEVAVLRNTSAASVIRCMEKFFMTHGLPVRMRTDNGPQFTSSEFREFMDGNGIEHIKGIPYWPLSNGEVERHNRTLLKVIRTAKIEKTDYKREVEKFMLAYRSTPHCTTGMSPAEMMFKRKLRTKLPLISELEGWEEPSVDLRLKATYEEDEARKMKMKTYADEKRRAKPKELQPGDQVLLKNEQRSNKMTPTYQEQPYEVVEKKGNAVVLKGEDGSVKMRSSAHMKKYEERPEHLTYTPDQETVMVKDSGGESPGKPELDEPPDRGTVGHPSTPLRRSDRTRKCPRNLADYELYCVELEK